MDADDLQQELMAAFEGESAGLLSQASQALMELESAASPELRAPIYKSLGRALHTLKGSGATCGLMDISELAHALEDRLAPLKDDALAVPPAEADLLLKSLDVMRQRIKAHAKGHGGKLVNIQHAMPEAFGLKASDVEAAAAAAEEAPAPEAAAWKVDESQVLGLMREVERLREHQLSLRDRGRGLLEVEAALREGRVEEARTLLGLQASAMVHDAENAAMVVELLEEQLKAIHSLPARRLYEALARAVRDACRATGKQARLALLGGEVAADKRLLESLRGPLLHLVRNALDHGIEDPALRDAAGKHREGVITLRFEQQGNLLLVEVADDGGGVDPERLRQAALKRGLKPEAELKAMDEKALLELIFEAGFSSKDTVTELSGRGVGLDVVRAQVEALKGSVELHSRVGQGTRFSLTLPLEMGATPLMMARAGAQVFGLPVAAVEHVVSVEKAHLEPGQRMRMDFRGQWLDVADLGALLGLRPPLPAEGGQALLVLQSNGRRVALLVDAVEGDAELVVLPLPSELELGARHPYAGASLYLGSELVLVLKSEWILAHAAAGEGPSPSQRRALVVDDSLTARAMHRAALEAGGFSVLAAPGGAEALALLARTRVDIVVSDIQMDGMDGFEFCRRMRATANGAKLPLVLVSVSDSESERETGRLAGASAFLNKRDCAAGRLVQLVQGLLGAA